MNDIDLMPALYQYMGKLSDIVGITTEVIRRIECCDHRETQAGTFHSSHHTPDNSVRISDPASNDFNTDSPGTLKNLRDPQDW